MRFFITIFLMSILFWVDDILILEYGFDSQIQNTIVILGSLCAGSLALIQDLNEIFRSGGK